MKHIKRFFYIVLFLGVFIGSLVGSYSLFYQGTTWFDKDNLARFTEEDDSYYLYDVPKDIMFLINSESKEYSESYTLRDAYGNEVVSSVQDTYNNGFYIIAPKNGYAPGNRYILELHDGAAFQTKEFSDARKLIFSIKRESVEKYTFTDNVVESPQIIEKAEENTIKLPDDSLKEGQILFGQDRSGEYVAYKIQEIIEDGEAKVEIPAIDEIYSELEVCGEYEWDVNEIVVNQELEAQIIKNVKDSFFFKQLMIEAYAEEPKKDGKIDVRIIPDEQNDTLGISIKITLLPGEKGLFGMDALKNQQVTISMTTDIGLRTRCNIQGITNWDLSASMTTDFAWIVDISFYKDEIWKAESDLEGLFSEESVVAQKLDYHKQVKAITEKLNKISSDVTGGEIKLFDWKLPIPSVPGLYFTTEVKLFAKFELAADAVVGQENTTVYTVGICFIDKKFDAYSSNYSSSSELTLSLRGKAGFKAGIKLVVKATLINEKVANISLDPQAGVYVDFFVTAPISGVENITNSEFAYSYFEPGMYFGADIQADLNLIVKQYEFSMELIEEKFPFEQWVLGNKKIAVALSPNTNTVRAVGNEVILPDIYFEYYDVKKGAFDTEKIDCDKLKFYTSDGKKLKVTDGKIHLIELDAESNCFVTVTYTHEDQKVYSTIFKIMINGSGLEGKVSAYTSDASLGEIEGASVDLYLAGQMDNPVASTVTEADGKFSFHVEQGEYCIVIAADGYKTLTSRQKIEENEIKYTEHILLINDTQTGNGSAGGTVQDALTGYGLADVTIRLRRDWNQEDGTYFEEYETYTDSNGKYSIENVPVGYYTVEAQRDGYVKGYRNIIVMSEELKDDFDFTITPILSNEEYRIVLTWGESPRDLDSHLLGRTPSDNTFNVYYSSKKYQYEGVEMANLDVDDTTSYGPETITILENIHGTYIYAVHNFSNRGSSTSDALSYSGAVVRVFRGSTQIAEYHVPTDQVGTYWTVFAINSAGNIVPVNTISNEKPVV